MQWLKKTVAEERKTTPINVHLVTGMDKRTTLYKFVKIKDQNDKDQRKINE